MTKSDVHRSWRRHCRRLRRLCTCVAGKGGRLVDRRGPGEETSFGNAGLIERASVFPYLFPRDWRALARYGVNGANEARYSLRDLPSFAPFLARYFYQSAPDRAARHARAALPLIEIAARA